ncbi:hypothetical protein B0H21DRAFT_688092 [Amylocystis lapponica]|nr:hypothetical protein B0H21DRAFT_688092 [Amylocystis lapponica]
MLDCIGLYTICSKMCCALKNESDAFGGVNMIFAGDFAQLPLAVSPYTLYTHNIDSVIHTTYSHTQQQAAIGKALWHQFTTEQLEPS